MVDDSRVNADTIRATPLFRLLAGGVVGKSLFLSFFLPHSTIWKFFRTSLFVPIYVLLFTNFGSQIGPFAVQRFFFLFVDQGFFGT